jgi:hypothetical protein
MPPIVHQRPDSVNGQRVASRRSRKQQRARLDEELDGKPDAES